MDDVARLRLWASRQAGDLHFDKRGDIWHVAAGRPAGTPRFAFSQSSTNLEEASAALMTELEAIGETVPTER